MSRRIEKGLDYTYLAADFFQDRKVRRLQRHCDDCAPIVYIALVLYTMKDGYFVKWDDETALDLADFAHLNEDYVKKGIEGCLEVGLLSKDMFDKHGILTSRGIQRQYAFVCEKNRRKCKIEEFSLIEDNEDNPEQSRAIPRNSAHNAEDYAELTEIPRNSEESRVIPRHRIEKNRIEENSKEYSFSSVSPSGDVATEAEQEKEKFVHYFTFSKNWASPNKEYEKLVAYNSGPQAKKKWANMTDAEKQAILVLWKQNPERQERFSDRWLNVWQQVYDTLVAQKVPYAVRMAALDDRVRWDEKSSVFSLYIPKVLKEYMEPNIELFKSFLWPFIQYRDCSKLKYEPY